VRYLITGGSGYNRIAADRDPRPARGKPSGSSNVDVRPPARPTEAAEFVRGRCGATHAAMARPARPREDRCPRPPRLHPQPDPRRGGGCTTSTSTAPMPFCVAALGGGNRAGARDLVGHRLWRLPRQPEADRRGLAGPGPARFLLRARHKADADRLCQLWAATHPERVMTIVRPSIVFGPNVDNYISRTWKNSSFPADPRRRRRGLPAHPRGRRS